MPPILSTLTMFPERVVLTGLVTLTSGIQIIFFARRVFFARQQHGIEDHATSGNPDFERILRAQQNALEWYPVFMAMLWTSSIFFSQVPSAICGVIYIISRQRHFYGYSRSDVERRLQGFPTGVRCLCVMAVMGVVGVGKTLLRVYLHHGGHCISQDAHPWAWRFIH